MLGNSQLEAMCYDNNKTRICHIRGAIKKKLWIMPNDLILINLREYQDGVADVVWKYRYIETLHLWYMGKIPEKGFFIFR